eukprot:g374.t1
MIARNEKTGREDNRSNTESSHDESRTLVKEAGETAMVPSANGSRELMTTTTTDVTTRGDLQQWIQRQEYINKSYDRLAKYNFALTYANLIKTSQVEDKCNHLHDSMEGLENAVDGVKRSLDDHSDMMTALEGNFTSMEARVEDHKKKVAELRKLASMQQTEVKTVLEGLSERVRRQQTTIDAQQRLVAKLGDSKFKQDAVIDISAILIAMVFSGSPVVDWPLQVLAAMLRTLVTGRRGRTRLSYMISIVRFAVFLACVRYIRRLAARSGLHNYVGSPSGYAKMAMSLIRSRIEGRHGAVVAAASESERAAVASCRTNEK